MPPAFLTPITFDREFELASQEPKQNPLLRVSLALAEHTGLVP